MKYKEAAALKKLEEFHTTYGLPVLTSPQLIGQDRSNLRINLLQEELNELKLAIEQHDLVEIADALADLQYVLSGAIHEFGLGEKFTEIFHEVHRSNMSKTCKTVKEAEETQQHYLKKDNTESIIKQKGEVFIVYRKSDSKVLKSINYSPANIEQFL